MKLLSFMRDDQLTWGALVARNEQGFDIIDGQQATHGRFATLDDVIAAEAIGHIADALVSSTATLRSKTINWRIPVRPRKLLAVGGNYAAHAREIGMKEPAAPVFFSRFCDSLVAPEAPLIRPRVSKQLDFEGELAVVIGKPGRYIDASKAGQHIAGYTCFDDGSVRDFQKQSIEAGKNFYATGSLGPWVVTSDELADPAQCVLYTRVNGEVMQSAPLSDLIHPVTSLIAYASTFTPLACGDVIATGTPAGIGARRTPQRWLEPGDIVEIEISRIGVLRNGVTDE
nr:fumarylacetoacetate hydrolase family protein [Pandoraea anhela]